MSDKAYLLYSDENQSKLYSIVYSESELKQESKFYSKGTWFEYDHIDEKFFINEKLYAKKVTFPKKPKIREKFIENNKNYNWLK